VKITCLVFILIGSAALTLGTIYAAPSNPDRASHQSSFETSANTVGNLTPDTKLAAPADEGKRQKGRNPSRERRDHRQVSEKNHARSPATIIKDRPKQLANDRERFLSGIALNFHQRGSDKSVSAANDGLIQNEAVKSGRALRRPYVIPLAGASPTNVRHRGANPAVIGGSANSNGKNTGAISGICVRRRP
jgi:hypothetical protein